MVTANGLHITEPTTMATDYLLALLSIILAVSFLKKASGDRRIVVWVIGLLVVAFAAAAGGTAHGFKLFLGEAKHAWVWNVTVVSIGLAAVLMLLAGIGSARRPTTSSRERREAGYRWLKAGLWVTALGLTVQGAGLSIHEYLNHNDIYHLIQMMGIYALYRGACALHDL